MAFCHILLLLIFWSLPGGIEPFPEYRLNVRGDPLVAPVDRVVTLWCDVMKPTFPLEEAWFMNGSIITGNSQRPHLFTACIEFVKIQTSDAGAYACRDTYDDEVVWRNFTVTVINTRQMKIEPVTTRFQSLTTPRPRIPPFFRRTAWERFIGMAVGKQAILVCPAGGYPTPNFTWLKDNQQPKRIFGKPIRAITWSMSIENLVPSDSGEYTCIVSNDEGTINRTFILEVHGSYKHILDGYPSNVTVPLGGQARFECKIISDSKPNAKWLHLSEKQGSDYVNMTFSYVRELKSTDVKNVFLFSLIINNVREQDQGRYTCLVANSTGSIAKHAWLHIQQGDKQLVNASAENLFTGERRKPFFTESEKMEIKLISKDAGSQVRFDCQSDGTPLPNITWWKNNQPAKRKFGREIRCVNWSLVIEDLQQSDSGQYTCNVTNEEGNIEWTYTLSVHNRINYKPVYLYLFLLLIMYIISNFYSNK